MPWLPEAETDGANEHVLAVLAELLARDDGLGLQPADQVLRRVLISPRTRSHRLSK
ncbi:MULTISPECIES: hypothetical protein [unclassified Thiocapsa]|uniref:hypothetical protein n=1 Tax=unclassified Thiocapsa TaxID=2641286 RepID=UPI0035B1660A